MTLESSLLKRAGNGPDLDRAENDSLYGKWCEKVPHLETIRKVPNVGRAEKGSSPGTDCVRFLTLEGMERASNLGYRLYS